MQEETFRAAIEQKSKEFQRLVISSAAVEALAIGALIVIYKESIVEHIELLILAVIVPNIFIFSAILKLHKCPLCGQKLQNLNLKKRRANCTNCHPG